jgi:hypothetical protein
MHAEAAGPAPHTYALCLLSKPANASPRCNACQFQGGEPLLATHHGFWRKPHLPSELQLHACPDGLLRAQLQCRIVCSGDNAARRAAPRCRRVAHATRRPRCLQGLLCMQRLTQRPASRALLPALLPGNLMQLRERHIQAVLQPLSVLACLHAMHALPHLRSLLPHSCGRLLALLQRLMSSSCGGAAWPRLQECLPLQRSRGWKFQRFKPANL